MRSVFKDEQKADLVFGAILDAMRRGIYPFDNPDIILPQDITNLPLKVLKTPSDQSIHAIHSCLWMQSNNNSVLAYRRLKPLAVEHWEEMFVPAVARKLKPERVTELLKPTGLGFYNARAKPWINNSEHIYQKYGGDSLNIFYDEHDNQITDWNVLYERLVPLWGFAYKIVSMAIYYHADLRLIWPIVCPSPADVQLHRLLTITECVGVADLGLNGGNVLYPEVMAAIREVTMDYCVRHGVKMEELADALWLFGRHMCKYAVGNRTQSGTGVVRKLKAPAEVVDWRPSQLARHNNYCRRCVIAGHCKWCYRSALYYTDKIGLLEPKPVPPAEIATSLPIGEPSYLQRSDAHRKLWTPR